MTAASAAAPSGLIRWHYWWYVAAATAVMIAAIASGDRWFLNFLHVFSGLLWTGIDVFMGFILGPVLRQVDVSVRREVAIRLTPRTLFLMPTLAFVTGTTGLVSLRSAWLPGAAVAAIRLGGGGAGPDHASIDPRLRRPAADQRPRLP